MSLTKEALLRGLCDEDLPCKLVCQNFWGSNTRLPEGTLERTVSLLEAMYSPNTEPHFLAYATNLLLEATSRSPDYQRPVFEHALTECTFQDYSVHSSWRQRHAAMTPLFAVTQVSQSQGEAESGDDQMDGMVRATQEGGQQFTATLETTGSSKAFNWLTLSSLDTYAESPSSVGGDSQLLFRIGSGGQGTSKTQSKGQGSSTSRGAFMGERKVMSFKTPKPRQDGATDGAPLAQSDVWRLKRRFLKDSDSQHTYYIKRNIRLRRLREEAVKEQRARRENQVTLYRKYRIGDFPDIQIKHQYLIAPLQALANRDNTIANLLFSSLFQAIFSEMDQVKTERQIEELTDQINKSIEAIFSQSVLYFPPFIGCILTILYELRSKLKVSASPVGLGAVVSNQQILGIMVLEEQLIQTDPRQASSSSKRPRQAREDVSLYTSLWIELSRLYKSVGEFDVLQGIFSEKLGTKEITRRAIEAEARGDYSVANKLYEEAISKQDWPDSDPQEAEVDFWDDSRMECLDYLTQWKELEATASKRIDDASEPNLERVWEDGFYQEHYLPYVMRSKLKLMLSGLDNADNNDHSSFLKFVDQALKDEQKKQHLQSRYCKELSQLFLWQGNYDTARHYTSVAFESFLQTWSSTTTLMEQSRQEHLHSLQGLVEQQEFLDFTASSARARNLSPSMLAKKWQGRSPHLLLDPVGIWDDIVTSRNLYLCRLAEKVIGDETGEVMDSQDSQLVGEAGEQQLAQMSVSLRLAMANSCRLQNNFSVTLKMLKNTKDTCKQLTDPGLLIEWVHLYAKTHQSKAKGLIQWTDEVFNNVCTTLEQLDKIKKNPVFSERPHLDLSQHVLTGYSLDLLVSGLLLQPNVGPGIRNKLAFYAELKNSNASTGEIAAGLVQKGFQTLKSVVAASDLMGQSFHGTNATVMTSDVAHLELAKFCDKYLHLKDDGGLYPDCDLTKFPVTAVVCLLSAMKGGVVEARQRFPRLLQIADAYPEVKDVFIKKAAEIPSWMFLLWISQMTALLDKPEAVVVAPVLLRIAAEYPQALIYPFRMSSEGYSFESGAQGKKNQEACQKLEELCNIPLVNKFISALEQFGQPDMIFKDWCGDVRKLLGTRKHSKAEIVEKFQEVVSQLFDLKSSASLDTLSTQTSFNSTASSVAMGDYRKGFAVALKDLFFKTFGQKGEKLFSMSSKDFSSAAAKITGSIENLQGQRGKFTPPTKIKDYCPWMADFNPSKSGDSLEIPGQYDGLDKPLPEYHVKISGFDERVLVMSSLRKPKRIMIRGNDEREYPYLVKSGEDLRLDQRIETLFFIMNSVMDADPACRQRRLHLKTYQVISMTPRVGLIEWMRNTQPLKEFLLGALTDDERRFIESDQAPVKQHMNWVRKIADKDNKRGWQGIYDKVYIKYSYTETVKEFRQKEGKIPWNLSRRAVQKLSSCPEAFYVLRSAMLRSHSVVCICQYLLGIGDRHLSNFMVNLKTGHMVGIDFGHAFGSATQFLPVPELMPFRLTRQMTNLNMPLQVKGQMESCMRHVLRALRADSDLLISTMDVFVKEPSLDWKNFAEKQMQEGKETDDAAEDEKWYPKQKIQFAQRKLQGDHPCYIMKDELELGHSKREAFRSFERVLMGDKRENVRTEMPAQGLTVEQQVAALIDHATDPNILGRTWGGWEPWV
ncbi:DNA-dependent protein kinase catalytic subunit [Plakobranchus ocellatus]|uniref:DNA-dependent protein kinase catalytic subunit n=1 Tax=Plakobranchus ocellatus TaxID=259542 RepID=A0AAV4B032_9GAST|nr:DNA-dependent protein kinase catalytic subunit [Plakobranchus ocellatus]